MSIAALIRRMAELGAPAEAIALAVEAVELEQNKDAERRRKRAEQKAKERERKATVARQSQDSRQTIPLDKERSPTPPKENSTLNPPIVPPPGDEFVRLVAVFPKRDGGHPKQPAVRALASAIRAGVEFETILRGAQAYSAEMRGKDPKFIPMLATWLNQRRWERVAQSSVHDPPADLPLPTWRPGKVFG